MLALVMILEGVKLMKLKHTVAAAVLAAPFLACAPASATLMIGAPATGGNYIPFGSIAGYPEYQQVYASSDFSRTVKIDDIEFYTFSGTGNPNTGVIKITLSTTSKPVNGLSTNLSQNIGSDVETVYDAKLQAVQSGVLDIQLSTPFTYNPADGNLLVDLVEFEPIHWRPFVRVQRRLQRRLQPGLLGPDHSRRKQLGTRDRLLHGS